MKYNERGEELPDSAPMEWPLKLKRPLTLREEVLRCIRTEMSQNAASAGNETFEEADDFAIGDEADDPRSRHELSELQEEYDAADDDRFRRDEDGDNQSRAGIDGKAMGPSSTDHANKRDPSKDNDGKVSGSSTDQRKGTAGPASSTA